MAQVASKPGIHPTQWVRVHWYVTAEIFPEHAAHWRKPSQLLPFMAHVEHRWAEGCTDGVRLWREIHAQGYGGSRRMLAQDYANTGMNQPLRPRINTGDR